MDVNSKTEVTVKMTGEEADMVLCALVLLRENGQFVNGKTLNPGEKARVADMTRDLAMVLPD